MNAPATTKPAVAVLLGVAMALGCGALLLLLAYSIGQLVPAGAPSSGWFDTRGLNRFLASMVLSCVGVIAGAAGGYFLGVRIAHRNVQLAVPAACLCIALPLIFVVVKRTGAEEARLTAVARSQEIARQESQRQMEQQKAWLGSSQYAEMVEKQLKDLEDFKSKMEPITYPRSHLVSTPWPRTLVFETADRIDAVESYFKTAPVTMGYFSRDARPYGHVYWTLNSFKGAIYIEKSGIGTKLTYSIE